MRKLLLALVLLPVVSSAQGVSRQKTPQLINLFSVRLIWTNTQQLGGARVPYPIRIAYVTGQIATSGGGGGGAGNSVITFTDGTNTCTATFTCASTATQAVFVEGTVANGAGTGCNYAANATITASVTTAGCTTTQPTPLVSVFALTR